MEREIGTEFGYGKYRVIVMPPSSNVVNDCAMCIFSKLREGCRNDDISGQCYKDRRSDGRFVWFKGIKKTRPKPQMDESEDINKEIIRLVNDGYKYSEIANAVGLTERAVISRVHYRVKTKQNTVTGKRMKKKFGDDVVERINEMRTKGKSVIEITREIGCSRSSVYQIIHKEK